MNFVSLLKNYVAESENMCYNNKTTEIARHVQWTAVDFFQEKG